MKKFNVAIAGATGAVGEVLIANDYQIHRWQLKNPPPHSFKKAPKPKNSSRRSSKFWVPFRTETSMNKSFKREFILFQEEKKRN